MKLIFCLGVATGTHRFVTVCAFLVIKLVFNGSAFSQTCSTIAPSKETNKNGNWNVAADWTPNGVPGTYDAGTDTYTIAAGTVVEIAHNFNLGSNLRIFGTLLVTGKLVVNAGKSIFIENGGLLTCCEATYCGGACQACGASDQVDIGGYKWKGTDGPVTGPATMDSSGLPVTLLSFRSSVTEHAVELSWSTATERNFDYFSIERSMNGIDFSEIGQVQGHGSSNIRRDYLFIDDTPFNGRMYYRLKSVDFDLYTEYFDPIAVFFKGTNTIGVYPNPSGGSSIEVHTNFFPNDTDTIIIYDHIGTKVLEMPVSNTRTEVSFSPNLDPGVYLVKYFSSGIEYVRRFVVMH
jgi:hypothetical protein